MIIKTETLEIERLKKAIEKGKVYTLPTGFVINSRAIELVEEIIEKKAPVKKHQLKKHQLKKASIKEETKKK